LRKVDVYTNKKTGVLVKGESYARGHASIKEIDTQQIIREKLWRRLVMEEHGQ